MKNKFCGKKSYRKKDAQTAKNFREKMANNRRADKLRIYQCPNCNLWHLAHKKND